jgi:hypothetical protein
MTMAATKKPLTLCGRHPRACVVGRDGIRLTFRFPCGYERTEVLTVGRVGGRKLEASPAVAARFASYWSKENSGVEYECPRCRRAALAASKQTN